MSYIIIFIVLLATVLALYKKLDIFDALICGAEDGLKICVKILPPILCLLSAVYMLRASGALELLSYILKPLTSLLNIPNELTPLIVLRPVTGSGALAIGSELIAKFGADSYISRVAAVILSASETTFYTIAVYFGAVGVKKIRYTLVCALLCELSVFVVASLMVKIFC